MREISYVRLNPAGNLTCVVLNQVPAEDRPRVTEMLMPKCEQVGYLQDAKNPRARAHLEMMGGEFCGNATMALAAYLSWMDQLKPGEAETMLLEVSGAENLIACEVFRSEQGWRSSVEMPMPTRMELCTVDGYTLDAVFLPGILHLIYTGELLENTQTEAIVEHLKTMYPDQSAIGLMQFDEERSTLKPLVWVRASDTQVWESACGSGTIAATYRQAVSTGQSVKLSLTQPAGRLQGEIILENGKITLARLSGMVELAEPETEQL